MKRMVTGILILALVLSIGIATAYAAGPRRGRNYVDADQDGVWDFVGSQCNWQDANGDGICDNCGMRQGNCQQGSGRGLGYVDQDGDGVCDNCGMRQGSCQQDGGRGCGYVDQNGDGVCDNWTSGGCHNNGNGCRKGCRG